MRDERIVGWRGQKLVALSSGEGQVGPSQRGLGEYPILGRVFFNHSYSFPSCKTISDDSQDRLTTILSHVTLEEE